MGNLYLGLDTETTGFKKKGALIQEGQARVCQLAMILADEEKKPIAKFSTFIKPDNWTISSGASKATGITDEMCESFGLKMGYAYQMYLMLASKCDAIIAHNSDFDKNMMEIEAAYYHLDTPKITNLSDCIPDKPWHCTAKTTTNIIKIPPTEKMLRAGFRNYKTPNLEEALQFFCNKSVGENAHDALVDAEACLEVFFASRNYQKQAA
jgi:DNA polymerase III subunit epsilon